MSEMLNKKVIICGGSKGIGLETAKIFSSLGADVCIIAREKSALADAELAAKQSSIRDDQAINSFSVDTTDEAQTNAVISEYINSYGVPDLLINNVGYAYPQYASKLSLSDYRKNMDVNYYGQLVPTLVLLPHFIKANKGHISFTSSMMGYFGIMGYAAYAPTKFALVGLAEVLRHELKPHNINISILYPPDTETPGFDIENETKPIECRKMSESVKALPASVVAQIFVNGLIKKKYHILPGEAKSIWLLNRFVPGIVRMILDRDYKKILSDLSK